MAGVIELLFFDTFSHESSEELNLDLVQFPKPVNISEVRIIPLGARVQADFPGGVRLGATNPSQFEIEFFVNDLSKPGASTFESLGGLDYKQNGKIQLETDRRQIPTDGLVLRGWYTTITLAVYGNITKTIQEQIIPQVALVPHPGPPITPGPDAAIVANSATAEWVQQLPQVADLVPVAERGGYVVEPPSDYGNSYSSGEAAYRGQAPWAPSDPGLPSVKLEPASASWEPAEDKWDNRKERHRGGDYRDRDKEWEDRRGWTKNHRPQRRSWGPRSPKRPHTPPTENSGPTTPTTSVRTISGSDANNLVKKEVHSPASSMPPAKFESLSPGDVESISDTDISEPEVKVEVVGPVTPSPPATAPATPPGPLLQPPTTPPAMDEDDVEQFEPILSDEEIVDEADVQFQDMDYEFNEEEEMAKAFNPFACDLQPLNFLSACEVDQCSTQQPPRVSTDDAVRLDELIATYKRASVTGGDVREEWVHLAEQVPGLLAKALPCALDKQDVTSTLVSWVTLGLDFEAALDQPQPGYKVRHIKAGIRLAEALCQCGAHYTMELVRRVDIQTKLLALYRRDFMALSIKLMILKAIDTTLNCKQSVEHFLLNCSGYRTLVEMALENQLARVKFAIGCLMRKVHLYEVLERLNHSVAGIVEKSVNVRMLETELDVVINSLGEILKVYKGASTLLSQPKRFLPVSAQFEIGSSVHDPYPSIYSFFRCHRLLEILLVLLSSPNTWNYSAVICPVQDLLSAMLDTQYGTLFLFANRETTTAILRLLLTGSSPEEVVDESTASTPLQLLGLTMAYRLQALQYVDALMDLEAGNRYLDPDSSEALEILNGLYCLGYTAAGKMALVHVLSRGDNIKALLRFFVQSDSQTAIKSPGKGYAADLVLFTVKFSDYVPLLRRYGRDILSAGMRDEKTFSSRLHEVVPWLKVLENASAFSYDDISVLNDVVVKGMENAINIPGELVTALRILKHLGVADAHNCDEYHQLKYKYVILQLFSLDGMANLTTILTKLCDNYEQPALHSTSFLGSHGLSLVSLVLPAVQLVRRMLTHVISCRNTQFKDLTAVPSLLRTFSLMHAFPPTAWAYSDAQKVCREIVETLLAYTQPVAGETSTETEALHKSLWTLMMSEVVKYVTTSPHTFISGLLILSELLPLPLPVHTRTPLPEAETQRTVNNRKLWSAHLHSLSSPLQEMIATMSGSSFQPLLQLLRRVCVQLSDLAAPTALIVTRAVLDPIMLSLTPLDSIASSHSARLLNFLACLTSHPAVKASVLHLLNHGSAVKSDERYPAFVATLCNVLGKPSDVASHVQAQECVLSVIQTLCDIEYSLFPPPSSTESLELNAQEIYHANALPPRDMLVTLCTAVLDHAAAAEHGSGTLLPTVRTFLVLSEHDYGLYHLKCCMDKNPSALKKLFDKFHTGFSGLNMTLHCALLTSLEFLNVCISSESYEDAVTARTLGMTVPELAAILGWGETEVEAEEATEPDKVQVKKPHPIVSLEKLLQECSTEDDSLENLLQNVTCLIRLLDDEGNKPAEIREWVEPILPPPDTLLVQFSARPVFLLGVVEEERLSSSYWLAPPPADDPDQDMDQVPCDLLELSREFLPDFQLSWEAELLCRVKATVPRDDNEDVDLIKKRGDDAKFLAAESRNKRPFVAPMRGRGFGRGAPQRGDLFRSRPPNTSRPPSLHVDDFVALEISGQQPTGPTGYNKLAMRAAKDMMCVRGRGRGRAFPSERGRFFGVTTTYRRENGRGIPRGANNGRGANIQVPSWTDGSPPGQQASFRSPESRDMRMMPRSEDKFPRFGRGVRPPAWPLKEHRERFNAGGRGGPRREPIRHTRTFIR